MATMSDDFSRVNNRVISPENTTTSDSTSMVMQTVILCLTPESVVMMISQTGIPYAMRFLPLPVLISMIILGGTVALAVWLAARRIKKIVNVVDYVGHKYDERDKQNEKRHCRHDR